MADISVHTPASAGLIARVWKAFTGFSRSLGMAMAANSTARARFDTVQRLQAMSDAELANLGLKRDDIVRHVFADIW